MVCGRHELCGRGDFSAGIRRTGVGDWGGLLRLCCLASSARVFREGGGSWQDFVACRQCCHCWQLWFGRKLSAMELIVIALIIAFVIFGLERNNRRTKGQPRLHGSTDIQNRDHERISKDLLPLV